MATTTSSHNSPSYRRQVIALTQFFSGRKCTDLLLDDMTRDEDNLRAGNRP